MTAIISGDSNSPYLISAMFRPSSGRSFPFEPTVIALSSEAKLTPSSVSSELAGIVASCFKGAEDLNRWTVANEWAVAYRKYSRGTRR